MVTAENIPADFCFFNTVFQAVNDEDWVALTTTTGTTAKVSDLEAGNTYHYTVHVTKLNGETVNGEFSTYVSRTIPSLTAPSGLKVSSVSGSNVTLAWNAVTDADTYDIYTYTASAGAWEYYGSSTAASIKITHTAEGTYKYRIRAYREIDGVKFVSSYSSNNSSKNS